MKGGGGGKTRRDSMGRRVRTFASARKREGQPEKSSKESRRKRESGRVVSKGEGSCANGCSWGPKASPKTSS